MIKTFNYEKTHITEIVSDILMDAVMMCADKIYIEPCNEYLSVNFNVNDKLVNYTNIPDSLKRVLYTRIKVIFGLNMTESNLEQHEKLSAIFKEKESDFNVSFIPTDSDQKVIIDINNC